MNKKEIEALADLVQTVAISETYERGAVCAVDCLLQAADGQLEPTMRAWERHLKEKAENKGHTETVRNRAWVPAIPIE